MLAGAWQAELGGVGGPEGTGRWATVAGSGLRCVSGGFPYGCRDGNGGARNACWTRMLDRHNRQNWSQETEACLPMPPKPIGEPDTRSSQFNRHLAALTNLLLGYSIWKGALEPSETRRFKGLISIVELSDSYTTLNKRASTALTAHRDDVKP